MRTAGYIESKTVSRGVGRKGDLRVVIFVMFGGVLLLDKWLPFADFGVESEGELFWIRAERLGVAEGESICRCYNMCNPDPGASRLFQRGIL